MRRSCGSGPPTGTIWSISRSCRCARPGKPPQCFGRENSAPQVKRCLLLALLGPGLAAAETSFKFTPTYYRTTNERSAYDLNLRANREAQTAWIGFYRRGEEFQQLRLGYEHALEMGAVRLVPSVQYASRGFLGASANAEIGERHFALVGLSRTNLKDYFNLNFDPNDSVLLGAGTRALARGVLTVYQIKDDRLGTGQHVTHFVL